VSALAELTAVYEDPRPVLEQWRGRVVGYMGRDVPRALVEAAGLLAYRLRGAGEPSARADAMLGRGVDAPARRVLDELLDGTAGVDFLLISHESQSLVRLFTALRALPDPLPEMWFVDLLHLPTETSANYNRARRQELRAVLERWSGRPLAPVRDRAAGLVEGVAALRREGRLRGSDALAVIGAGEILPAPEYEELLGRLLAEEHEPLPAGRRVYLTGSEQVTPDLYRSLEVDGLHVVGEDTTRLHGTNERAAATAAAAKAAGADLVVAWIRTGDDALAWGLPALRRVLDVELVVHEQQ
jgi:hypothetical protein